MSQCFALEAGFLVLTLDLVRHAEPEWAPEGIGVADPSLSELGQAQADRLGNTYADDRITHFYCSPLARARESASPIAKRLGREPEILDWTRELDLPPMTGMPWSEIESFFRRYRARPLAEWWRGPDGEEDYRQLFARVTAGVDGLLAETFNASPVITETEDRLYSEPSQTANIVMVAHVGTIGTLMCHLMGFDLVPWIYEKMSLGYAGICRLRTVPLAGHWTWSLTTFNERTHLGDDIL